ncbi:unnamed protein product, partial [Prorocentrum cordatum]
RPAPAFAPPSATAGALVAPLPRHWAAGGPRWPGAPAGGRGWRVRVAAGGDQEGLRAETQLLRKQVELLTDEIRLLREALLGEPLDAPPAAAPAAPAAATPQPSPPPSASTALPPLPPMPPPPPAQPAAAPGAQRSTFPTASAPPPQPAYPPPAAAPAPSPPAWPPVPDSPLPGGTGPAQAGAKTAVKIVSSGYENGNRADFFFDGRLVGINGFFDRRGANVMVIDPDAGKVTLRKSYDIWGDPQTVNPQFSADLRGIPQGHIVLVACKDGLWVREPRLRRQRTCPNGEGTRQCTSGACQAINAMRGVGATIAGPLGVREGYALIGVRGGPAWAESQGKSCEVEWDIPCAVEFPPPPPPMAGAVAAAAAGRHAGHAGRRPARAGRAAAGRLRRIGRAPRPPPGPQASARPAAHRRAALPAQQRAEGGPHGRRVGRWGRGEGRGGGAHARPPPGEDQGQAPRRPRERAAVSGRPTARTPKRPGPSGDAPAGAGRGQLARIRRMETFLVVIRVCWPLLWSTERS